MHKLLIATLAAISIGILVGLMYNPQTNNGPSEEICDLIDNDGDGQIDEGFARTCTTDTDCGESGPFGETYCQDGDVYQRYYEVRCVGEIGTCQSACQSQQTQQIKQDCQLGCNAGLCVQ